MVDLGLGAAVDRRAAIAAVAARDVGRLAELAAMASHLTSVVADLLTGFFFCAL